MFSLPLDNKKILDGIWNNYIIQKSIWAEVVDSLVNEWQVVVINAGVLLNAGIVFLITIPGRIDEGPDGNVARVHLPQIFCEISIFLALTCIVTGFLLGTRLSPKSKRSPEEIASYLYGEGGKHRLATLAAVYSLPYGLLLWAAISFVVAVGCNSFATDVNWERAALSVVSFTLLCFLLWILILRISEPKRKTKRLFRIAVLGLRMFLRVFKRGSIVF